MLNYSALSETPGMQENGIYAGAVGVDIYPNLVKKAALADPWPLGIDGTLLQPTGAFLRHLGQRVKYITFVLARNKIIPEVAQPAARTNSFPMHQPRNGTRDILCFSGANATSDFQGFTYTSNKVSIYIDFYC